VTGKTSILNCISGFYHPTQGKILYGDTPLTHCSPHEVSNMGIARAFQNLELFSGLSVLDNLLLARHQNLKYSFLQALFFMAKPLAWKQKIAHLWSMSLTSWSLSPTGKAWWAI